MKTQERDARWDNTVTDTISTLERLYQRAKGRQADARQALPEIPGDVDAQQDLLEIAEAATRYLALASEERKDDFRVLAAVRELWPAFIGPREDHGAANMKTVVGLSVGSKHQPKVRAKRGKRSWSFETLKNKVVWNYLSELFDFRESENEETLERAIGRTSYGSLDWMHEAVRLPELSPDSAEDWFPVIWTMIREDCDFRPEQEDPPKGLDCLRPIGVKRKVKSRSTSEHAKETSIRSRIREKLRETFLLIVRDMERVEE